MFTYNEYKCFNQTALVAMNAAISHCETSGESLELTIPGDITAIAIESNGFEDRPADLNGIKGFLGFMLMVSRFPTEFLEDLELWVDVHVTGKELLDLLMIDMESEFVQYALADPDVVMALQFINNPSTIIK